jgi:replication factor A1
MWGDLACRFEVGTNEHPVVALKRVTVSEYNGKSLNSNENSHV